MNLVTMSKRPLFCLSALAALVVATLAARPALASEGQGPVTQVEYNAGSSSNPQLMVQLNGNSSVNYLAQQPAVLVNGQGCAPALSIDTIKIFASTAQAALLAGKSVNVYYNVCNGSDYIYDIVIDR